MPVFNWNFHHQSNPQKHLQSYGLLINVEVSTHPSVEKHLVDKGETVPSPISTFGIIDTGATLTSIDLELARKLDLFQVGEVQLSTAAGPTKAPRYPFTVTLATGLSFNTFGAGCDLRSQNIDVLVGMDLLSSCLFVMNGPNGDVTIAT